MMIKNNKIDPLEDGISSIELIDFMGGDLAVVNDARVSYAKHSKAIEEKDTKLINYLIKHQHTSPFRSTVFKFRVKAPLAIARQWYKHHVASSHSDEQDSWNEQSFRYVEAKPEFYVPKIDNIRGFSQVNKQSSVDNLYISTRGKAHDLLYASAYHSNNLYQELIKLGVCKEQARLVLPPSIYTQWIWTTSLQAVLHFLDLRKGAGAQDEITAYALAIEKLISSLVPHTMQAWNEHNGQ